MSIWDRIREGIAELSWGGLFGLDESADPGDESGRPAGTKQIGFTIAAIALAAKMAKADGDVSSEEIDAFHEVFQAPEQEREHVDFFFNLARRSATGAETYARQAAKLLDGQQDVLEDLLGALFHIAKADGRFDPAEDAYLRRIAAIFGFDEPAYARIRTFHMGAEQGFPAEADPWLVLGLPPRSTAAEVKARYRQLVRDSHPDAAMARGLPAEFIAIANAKLARINAAYDRLKPRLSESAEVAG